MMIERDIYMKSKYRIEPLDVVYGSNKVGIKLNVMDFEVPAGATAEAHARRQGSMTTYKNACSVTGNSISFYPREGFFLPGTNLLQIVLTMPGGHALTFVLTANCEQDIVEGIAFNAEEVIRALERAEALLETIMDVDAITAEEIDAAYDYDGGTGSYEILDDKRYER